MAAAGISSLVVEVFSRADSEKPAVMPRDMSLEIGLKISGQVDQLMGKVQVCFEENMIPCLSRYYSVMGCCERRRAIVVYATSKSRVCRTSRRELSLTHRARDREVIVRALLTDPDCALARMILLIAATRYR